MVGISVRELISTLKRKKKKEVQVGNERSNILPKTSQAKKNQKNPTTTSAKVNASVLIHKKICIEFRVSLGRNYLFSIWFEVKD